MTDNYNVCSEQLGLLPGVPQSFFLPAVLSVVP